MIVKDIPTAKAELKKCSNDPVYFISNYIKVVHPIFGLVNFDLYQFQQGLVKDFRENRFCILRKFRQAGCTTLVAAYSLWKCLFNKHFKIAIISKDDDASMELLARVKMGYEELPEWFKSDPLVKVAKDNDHTFQLVNGSSIKSKSSSKQSGRSISGSLLILDEAAFIENIDTIWGAAYPIISTGGSVIALSTVNGIGNWFHRTYIDAVNKDNDFKAIDINWKSHPQYFRHQGYEKLYADLAKRTPPILIDEWEKVTRKNLPHKQWLQEYEAEFLGTGDTFVDGEILRQLKDNINRDYYTRYNNRMRIWKEANAIHDYCIGVDTSLGRSNDYSTFHIFNIYDGEQVAEFRSNTTPINEFASILAHEARVYNNACIIPERNNIGFNLIYELKDVLEYDNIFLDEKGELGIQTAENNKKQMLVVMDDAIRKNKIKINSERMVDELLTFIIDENGKFVADENCHDDLIMSLAFSVHAFNHILETTPMLQHRANDDNMEFRPVSRSKYMIRTPTGALISEEDYKWILS